MNETLVVDASSDPALLVVGDDDVLVVSFGEPGPVGPSGAAAGPVQALIATAGSALGGHRVVAVRNAGGYSYVDPTEQTDGLRACGLTTGAAASGALVTIQTRGPITEPSWSWIPDLPIYAGLNGVPTQTLPPGVSFVLVIGVALTATSMFVQFSSPIFLP